MTSDGGLLLLRQADRQLGLTKALAGVLPDPRDPERIVHPLLTFLRQRVYGLCLGYEDLNDHDHLRQDLVWQTVAERDAALASSPTLCRWENRADRKVAWLVQEIMVNQFIGSFAQAPRELVLDFDSTDDRVHGQQEGRFFHGYYGNYCFLPLYVFCGEQLLGSYLRPSNQDNARHAWAILKLLVRRLRQAWPQVKLVVRADSGFCRWRMLRWCEDHGVGYVMGLAKNSRLLALAQPLMDKAQTQHEQTREKQRRFGAVQYGAASWDRARRVGISRGAITLGSFSLGEGTGLLLCKYSAAGQVLSVHRIAYQGVDANSSVYVYDFGLDAAGDLFLSSFPYGGITDFWGTAVTPSTQRGDGYIARFNSTAGLEWVRLAEVQGSIGVSTAVDRQGNTYFLESSAWFGKLDPNGQILWQSSSPDRG